VEEGVSIRPYAPDDAARLFEAVSESLDTLSPWLPWCHAGYSAQESRLWVESQVEAFAKRTEFAFVIVSTSGRFLGGCGLNHVDFLNRRANLGYWVRASETGRGVASLAVALLARWAFENTDFVRLEIVAANENVASLRVAEKSGAVREGVFRDHLLLQGKLHDATVFSILRREAARASGSRV
jgi:RimJ/RimL family protein N-acetyltransferase